MKYMLDTNTCIFFLKGMYPSIRDHILSCEKHQIAIPSMVKAELLLGAQKSSRREATLSRVNTFLNELEIVSFDDAASIAYADIRAFLESRGEPIGEHDLMIAATVMAHNGVLVTHNTREFGRIPRLLHEDWVDVSL